MSVVLTEIIESPKERRALERARERSCTNQETKRLRAKGLHEQADLNQRKDAAWKLCQEVESVDERLLLLSYVVWPTEQMDALFASLRTDA